MNFECESWNDEASIITNLFLVLIISKIGMPIFPPSENLNLFLRSNCASNLQVVDLPFVPVTTILLDLFLVK